MIRSWPYGKNGTTLNDTICPIFACYCVKSSCVEKFREKRALHADGGLMQMLEVTYNRVPANSKTISVIGEEIVFQNTSLPIVQWWGPWNWKCLRKGVITQYKAVRHGELPWGLIWEGLNTNGSNLSSTPWAGWKGCSHSITHGMYIGAKGQPHFKDSS